MSDLTKKYPIHHLLQSLQQGEISISGVETRINGYMQAISIKARGEMKLEILAEIHHKEKVDKKSYQALCDMEPQRTARDPLSVAEIEAIQTHLNEWKEG